MYDTDRLLALDLASDVRARLDRARTPFGEIPLSSVYGVDFPKSILDDDCCSTSAFNRHNKLSDCVDYMIRSSRASSESRYNDPYYNVCHNLSYWPMALTRGEEPGSLGSRLPTIDASVPLLRDSTPSTLRESTPMRTTSISYSSTSPWNSTGFYYSPRYPESYRGTSSTYSPYSYCRRYYDYDVFNPDRIEYFKWPRRGYGYIAFKWPRKGYGFIPYKYSRKWVYPRYG